MYVEITDVFLRDGLQDESVIVPTDRKLQIARRLQEVGVPRIEVASFVNPKRVPQMADADDLFAARPEGAVTWIALALNARGITRAQAAGASEISVVASASDAHSSANAGGTTREMLANQAPAIQAAQAAGTAVIGGISTAFTCPFEGEIPAAKLVEVVRPFTELGITTIGLADTLGNAEPAQVTDSVKAVQAAFPGVALSLHLHNAHGRALETVAAALELGITRFDSALGGFGGCPFAPGAAGNLNTLELVEHLHALGVDTGIDVAALAQLSADAADFVAAAPALA
ncbi:hydroxymethylglutaryl-CoA lyase [Corynebacterium sp. YIM 101645]|uniref:Hydroxymethylglutaryl-CoA lyase n=1 Tax=Corynebacterium lemuris TaxID=1859292 RepID=A0ABT2FYI8_9CORY|nr:hydroxymethylglutaryl-CoA lyase [Corynebacterium lemuris]MCS5480315.1 hydroxymethylglutaryl-CoA lyase [Corynebacterium lemuris]